MGLQVGIPCSGLARASACKRLWLAAAGVALFIATILCGHAVAPRRSGAHPRAAVDFIAFYTAGTFVREGRIHQLYDLGVVKQFQHELAGRQGQEVGGMYGPWWNPPFYAIVFAPLSRLSYTAALNLWLGINLLCASASCWLLCRMLPEHAPARVWGLVPVLVGLSAPFIYAISHAQNTCTSLLLLTGMVGMWRTGKLFAAGLLCGLLFYKPQLAAVLAIILVLDRGWRAAAGLAITGAALLLVNLVALPGTLTDYLHRLPANLYLVQSQSVYPWDRHVTFQAFWRLLLQGRGPGETWRTVTGLAAAGSLIFAGLLVAVCRAGTARRDDGMAGYARPTYAKHENRLVARDRIISAAIAATPLVMPFYFDYDLLLLAVPAVLLAAERMRRPRGAAADRWLMAAWAVFYSWLMLNPDVADKTRVNFAVPLLAIVTGLMIRRAFDGRYFSSCRPCAPTRTIPFASGSGRQGSVWRYSWAYSSCTNWRSAWETLRDSYRWVVTLSRCTRRRSSSATAKRPESTRCT